MEARVKPSSAQALHLVPPLQEMPREMNEALLLCKVALLNQDRGMKYKDQGTCVRVGRGTQKGYRLSIYCVLLTRYAVKKNELSNK